MHEFLQRLHREILVKNHSLLLLHLLDDSLKWVDVFLVYRFHTEHHVAIHLHEATVRVIDEVRIVGLLHHSFSHLVIKTEVEDGVHHARHGSTRTRAYGYEQRILYAAKLAVHQCLDVLYRSLDIIFQQFYDLLLSDSIVFVTCVSSNSKTWRYWYSDKVHLGQIGTLATECLAHLRITFGLSVSEGINSFFVHSIY